MTFQWPWMLFALLAVPLVVALYLRTQRRQRTLSSRFYGVGGLSGTTWRGPGLRRHLPAALFLVSLTVILVALARPQAQVALPRVEGTVMLVFDVSGSMAATDVQPSRLEAAKTAARAFVLSQPSTVKIGVVAFNGSGFTVQHPTNDSNALLSTINRLQPNSGTSLGHGMITALNTIAVEAGLASGQPSADQSSPATQAPGQGAGQDAQGPGTRDAILLAQLPEGPYPSAEIVLLSDGENNQGIDPVIVAKAAAEHGVLVYALGFGTTTGATISVNGFRVHTALDEDELRRITQEAGGTYFPAQGDQDPSKVYASLTPSLVVRPAVMEITSVFAGAGIVALLAGSLLSMVWFRRLV